MKFFSKIQIFGVALATLVAFGFTGCDEVKSLAASVSIEEPLVTIEYSPNGNPYLNIQSQDNDTIIEDVIINRGNCAVLKYEGGGSKSYKEAHPDRCESRSSNGFTTEYCKLRTQSGELLDYEDMEGFGYLYSNATSMDYYNALDDESKATYDAFYPQKLPYGKKFAPQYVCKTSDIIEVELVVNGGGRLTYSFK